LRPFCCCFMDSATLNYFVLAFYETVSKCTYTVILPLILLIVICISIFIFRCLNHHFWNAFYPRMSLCRNRCTDIRSHGHSFPRDFRQGRTFVLTSNDHPGHSCSRQMTTPDIRAHIKLPPRTFVLTSNYHPGHSCLYQITTPDIRSHDYSVLKCKVTYTIYCLMN